MYSIQYIHIDEYKNDKAGLSYRITEVTGNSRRPGLLGYPSGDADLGKALDLVRENSFKVCVCVSVSLQYISTSHLF